MAANDRGRVDWVDYGKGLSIVLVVFHHAIADLDKPHSAFWSPTYSAIDEVFALFRMPLFFLMAGIFAAKALKADWPEFIDKKVLHFLYLFVLWSLIVYLYTIALPHYLVGMKTKRLDMIFYIFVDPPRTLWFIYALMLMFLLTRVLRAVPLPILVGASLTVYLLVLDSGLQLNTPFPEKVVRLYLFFLLGCWLSPHLQKARHFVRPWHLLLSALYIAFAWAMIEFPQWRSVGLVLVCQIVGVISGIVMAELMSRGNWFHAIRVVGTYSLAVYVMHRLVLFTLEQISKVAPSFIPEINVLVALALAVSIPILIAKLIQRYRIPGLLEKPRWLSVRKIFGVKESAPASVQTP
ncbi:MAG TPA: acyltransferase [Burkholderiales bacterium]|nr:acyltransferase [Burkholderiales bacterium]